MFTPPIARSKPKTSPAVSIARPVPKPAGPSAADRRSGPAFDSRSDFSTIPAFADESSRPSIPSRLEISAVDDPRERHAERVAEQVTGMPETQATGGRERRESSASVHDGLRSPGRPLEDATSSSMAARFGRDFSHVRVHTDAEAAHSARAVGALAYTVGRDIVFGEGEYAPGSPDGKRLLAHELAHVAQHSSQAQAVVSRKPGDQTEEKERAKLLTDFTDGAGLSDKIVGRIQSAMSAFSLSQLHAMQKSGLRFWPGDSLPPEFADRVKRKNISTPAEYLDAIHVIRMVENASTDAIRHEMAHSWDHARTGKVKPLGKLKDKEFEQAVQNPPPLLSATDEKRATLETQDGKSKAVKLTISDMLARYKQWKLREQSFDNPSTREGYSKSSPREFYAEGYSVFHSNNISSQGRLLYYAPELYELLESEAKHEGLDIPDRSKVEAEIKEQRLPPP